MIRIHRIEVDRFFYKLQPKDFCIEIHRALGIGTNNGDVVNAKNHRNTPTVPF
jgi:hypothetical protein